MNVNLELTDHCNLRCTMCSQSLREEAHGAPHRFMPFGVWEAGVAGLAGLPDVTLCPHWLGEPTLHPEFDRFVRHAFDANVGNRLFRHFKLHTNAVILPEGRARLLVELATRADQAPDTFQAIHLSVDADTAPTYARVKGADRHDLVVQNVERLLTVRGRDRGPALHVAFVVQDGNADEAAAFVARWAPRLGGAHAPAVVTGDWPPMDRDAVYLRRWNCADQAHADHLHAAACRSVGIVPPTRPAGAF